MPNQALEQTRDNVLRHGESVGCELLNFFVIRQDSLKLMRGDTTEIHVVQVADPAECESDFATP